MKKVMASAGLLALGVVGVRTTLADPILPVAGPSEKPWTVSGTLNGFYDDNYNTVSPNTPGVQRRGTFGFQLEPSITLKLPANSQTDLSVKYQFDMLYYQDRPSNKADYDNIFDLLAGHRFNERYRVDVSEEFVNSQDPQVLDPSGSVVARVNGNNIRNTAAIKLTSQITPLFGVVASYQNTLYAYDQTGTGSLSAQLDRLENLITVDTTWQLTPDTMGIVGYMFGLINHTSSDQLFAANPGPPATPSGSPNLLDNYSHTFYVGAQHTFTRDLSGTAKAGASYYDYYNDSAIGTSWGPYVDLSGSWTYMNGGVLTGGFHVSRNETDVGGTSAANLTQDQLSEMLYGTVSQQITPKLNGALTGTFQNATFNGGVNDGESDQIYTLGLQFVYQFTHYLSGNLGYDYTQVDSNIPLREYDRNQVFLGVTATY
jgi:hypothetical protein